MSGDRYLADTNTFIYLLQGHPRIQPLLKANWSYSFITEIELLGKPGISRSDQQLVKGLLSISAKVHHSDAIDEQAIALKQLRTPDAIIAGSALYLNLPLLTADVGFLKVKKLDIILIEL
jgi:hypothetical protein